MQWLVNRIIDGNVSKYVGFLFAAALLVFSVFLPLVEILAENADIPGRPVFSKTQITIKPMAQQPFVLNVEVAQSDFQHQYGLMFSSALAPMTGMLFVFDAAKTRHFWMKNTPIPLDILFFDSDGMLVSVAQNAPPNSQAIIQSAGPARYVLEIAAGEAARLGVEKGTRLVLPVLSSTLRY